MRNHFSDEELDERTAGTEQSGDTRRTALLAYEFWRARGCPEGSADEDWFLAEEQLRHQQNYSSQRAA